MKYLISILLCFQLSFSVLAESEQRIQKESNIVIKLLKRKLDEKILETPDDSSMTENIIENKKNALAGIQEIKEQLSDSSYSFDAIKMKMARQMDSEIQSQLIELNAILRKMNFEELTELVGEAKAKGFYDSSVLQDFDFSYTLDEKREVILRMASQDFSLIKSANVKRLGMMTRESLHAELLQTEALINIKGNNSWKIVLAVVLTVVAAGFMTWGIVAGTKRRLARKTSDMHDRYDRLEDEERAYWANAEDDLRAHYKEMERLREAGYTWQICSTTSASKTTYCSFNNLTHSGSEVCQTRCLKSPGGDEAFHQVNCTSAYIPSNCHLPNPYDQGFDDGYDVGFDRGYERGYDNGWDTTYRDAYNHSYSYGYDIGYDEGWQSGYDSGYSSGYSDGMEQSSYEDDDDEYAAVRSEPDQSSRRAGYKKGYREGYLYAIELIVGV